MSELKELVYDIKNYVNICKYSFDVDVKILKENVDGNLIRHIFLVNGIPCGVSIGENEDDSLKNLLKNIIAQYVSLNAHKNANNIN